MAVFEAFNNLNICLQNIAFCAILMSNFESWEKMGLCQTQLQDLHHYVWLWRKWRRGDDDRCDHDYDGNVDGSQLLHRQAGGWKWKLGGWEKELIHFVVRSVSRFLWSDQFKGTPINGNRSQTNLQAREACTPRGLGSFPIQTFSLQICSILNRNCGHNLF